MKKKFLFLIIFTIFLLPVATAIAKPIDIEFNDGIYHIILSGNKIKKQIHFVSSANLITNKTAHENSKSLLTINTGFFDPKNQKTISYIVDDYSTIEDPRFNENLLANPVLRANLPKILNRTELRILDCDGKLKYDIAPHNADLDFMCSIRTSAQGGPQLLPDLKMEEEFFIIKDSAGNITRESCSVLHKVPRTLVGIKSNKGEQELHIFIVTNQNPLTIPESRDLCASYGLEQAMAFDGGSSTSLDYKDIHVVSTQKSGDTGRALKSFLVIKK